MCSAARECRLGRCSGRVHGPEAAALEEYHVDEVHDAGVEAPFGSRKREGVELLREVHLQRERWGLKGGQACE